METIRYFTKDALQCFVYEDRGKMGKAAARDIIAMIHVMLSQKPVINMMFGAAPSQNEVLAGLREADDVDWTRINCFHMDEYIGLSPDAPQGFGNFLRKHLFGHKPFAQVNYISPETTEPEKEAARYEALLKEHPIDICVLGVGENGHVAFNDPPVADFKDTRLVKPVKLDPVCRQQQVNEKCFERLDLVPSEALTLTVPALLRGRWLFCIVPFASKAEAVRCTLYGEISEHCPASVLRNEADACLYLTAESARLLPAE